VYYGFMKAPMWKTEGEVVSELRERVKQFGRQTVIARQLGFTPQYLCDVLKNKRPVSENLALAMGYKRLIVFANNGKRKP